MTMPRPGKEASPSTPDLDAERKLARLRLPKDLSGKRVLDIGCKDGHLCKVAKDRGAIEVIGIDFESANIEAAKLRHAAAGIRFLCQSCADLPDGPFDLIVWGSTMHYELDPKSVITAIAQRLACGGLLVLECGVILSPGKCFMPVPRVADTRWYPSRDLLIQEILSGFSVRQIAEAEITAGDSVPRSVFHCTHSRPVVLLVRGVSGDGKSTVTERLRASATKIIDLDMWVSKMGTSRHPHDSLEQFMIDHYDPGDLSKIYRGIDRSALTKQYAEWLAKAIAPTDAVVIIEGDISDGQSAAIERALRNTAIVWDMKRIRL